MRKIIIHTIQIIVLIFLINALLCLIDALFFNKKIMFPKVNIVVMGDSNARNAINDSILKKSINISQGGESYLFVYVKLKKILNDGNKIDTLLLTFAPHNIVNNNRIKKEGALKYRMSGFYKEIGWREHIQLFKMQPKNYIKSWMPVGGNILNSLLNSDADKKNPHVYGRYSPVFTKNPDHDINTTENPELTSVEIEYLDKVIDLAKKNNIHLILLCTPKNYSKLNYEKYREVFYNYYNKNLHTIDFLDFTDLYHNEDYFADTWHLMSIGADKFSIYLNEQRLKKLLRSSYNLKKE